MRMGIVLGVVLVLAGCSTHREGPAPDRSSSAPASVTAADGTDLTACVDGNCEVELSGPASIKLSGQGGVATLSVEKVGDEGVTYTATSPDGSTSDGELSPGCTLKIYEGGGGSSCYTGGEAPRPEPQTGVLAMQLTSVRDGKAVLLLVAGEPGEPEGVPQAPTIHVPVPTMPDIPG